jgi:hypothetical protein
LAGLVGLDHSTADMLVNRHLYLSDKVKLDLTIRSFNVMNRDSLQIDERRRPNHAGQFVQVDKRIGINTFPGPTPPAGQFPASHTC